MKKIVHVNQHVIRRNAKTGEREPVLSVKTYNNNDYAHEVVIHGPCVIRYSPDKPLPCGARVWIETESAVTTRSVASELSPEAFDLSSACGPTRDYCDPAMPQPHPA